MLFRFLPTCVNYKQFPRFSLISTANSLLFFVILLLILSIQNYNGLKNYLHRTNFLCDWRIRLPQHVYQGTSLPFWHITYKSCIPKSDSCLIHKFLTERYFHFVGNYAVFHLLFIISFYSMICSPLL